MADLLAVQSDIAAALRDASQDGMAARWLVGEPALVQRRLAIYRANMIAAADKALAAAYPVVREVVGTEFFHGLARAYQRAHPSTSGDLGDFGADYPTFLETFEPAQALPYLPDLARLEWAVHRAQGAADALAWDPAGLAAVAADDQEAIRFTWAAGTAVVVSPYPVVRVWQLHQPGNDGAFAVDWAVGERAQVARAGYRVAVTALASGDAAFLVRSLSGATLGAAAAHALQLDPQFDLGGLLGRAVASALILGFTLDKEFSP